MKHKLQKMKVLLLLLLLLFGLSLTPLQSQVMMNLKQNNDIQTSFNLSSIRKLTFPTTVILAVVKTTGSTDSYILSDINSIYF